MRVSWKQEMDDFLTDVVPGNNSDVIRGKFYDRFGIMLTIDQLRNRCVKLCIKQGVRCPVKPKKWTPERVEYFKEIVPGHSEKEIAELFFSRFGLWLNSSQIGNAKNKYGVRSGTTGGRFEKGNVPFMKGMKWKDYMPLESQERCRATQFKKGEISTRRDGHIKPLGFERVDRDGYTWVKVHDGLQEAPNKNYREKHRVIWEQHHGAIPDGCNVVFADGDRTNFDIDNLVLVPRSVWSTINKRSIEYSDEDTLKCVVAYLQVDQEVRRLADETDTRMA